MPDNEFLEEYETITLTDEDGREEEFAVIDALEIDGESYILVVETDTDNNESMAMILKKTGDNGNDISYEIVEDDSEFDKVAGLFQENGEDYEVKIEN